MLRDAFCDRSKGDRSATWRIVRSLIAQADGRVPTLRVLLIAAHPDDETIGAAGLLSRLPRCELVYLTDGAPRDLRWAPAARGSREDYAEVRRREAAAALSLLGVADHSMISLGAVDQEAAFAMPVLARHLADRFHRFGPDLVLTHAYEGGHPDHDAAAFTVHAAAELLRRRGVQPPVLVEMTSYHARNGAFTAGEFLPLGGLDGQALLTLTPKERGLKRRMLECFETQREVLALFPLPEVECFREAPAYRFTEPPHAGPLLYEIRGFPFDGERWRDLARQALRDLELPEDEEF
jgi:LmbE family N-acetylglucosaminyl deacetylase